MNKFLSFIFIFFSTLVSAQNISEEVIKEYEDTLKALANNIIYGKTFEIREKSNISFLSEIKEVMKFKESYHYPFESLETISKLSPEDNSFRLFNWILPEKNGENKYFAIIILPSSKDNYNQIIELKHRKINPYYDPSGSANLRRGMNDIAKELFQSGRVKYDNENWYGALYYKIISPKKKNNKHYTLLGWDGNKQHSIIKIIDVIQIDSNKINFGKNIFYRGKERLSRIAIEYRPKANVSVHFDSEKNRIVLDHLGWTRKDYEDGDYMEAGFTGPPPSLPVPDGSYDCFSYINGKWIFEEDIDVKTKKSLPKIKKNTNKSNLFKK